MAKKKAPSKKPAKSAKPEDYKQAYQTIAHAFDDPAMTLHYRAEGRYSYAVLLFAPIALPSAAVTRRFANRNMQRAGDRACRRSCMGRDFAQCARSGAERERSP